MVGLVYVVGLGASHVEIEVQVTLAPIVGVAGGVEEVAGVLPNGLEEPITSVVAREVDRHEGSAHELVQHVDSLGIVVIDAHGGERRQVTTASERAHRVQRRLGRCREILVPPVDGGTHRAMARHSCMPGRRQRPDRVVEQVGELYQ